MSKIINGETVTASFCNDTWTCVDESGQRFWPAAPCASASAALDACESGKGTWRY